MATKVNNFHGDKYYYTIRWQLDTVLTLIGTDNFMHHNLHDPRAATGLTGLTDIGVNPS